MNFNCFAHQGGRHERVKVRDEAVFARMAASRTLRHLIHLGIHLRTS